MRKRYWNSAGTEDSNWTSARGAHPYAEVRQSSAGAVAARSRGKRGGRCIRQTSAAYAADRALRTVISSVPDRLTALRVECEVLALMAWPCRRRLAVCYAR